MTWSLRRIQQIWIFRFKFVLLLPCMLKWVVSWLDFAQLVIYGENRCKTQFPDLCEVWVADRGKAIHAKVSGVLVGLRTTREIDLKSLKARKIVIYGENRYKTQFPDFCEVWVADCEEAIDLLEWAVSWFDFAQLGKLT